MESKDQTPERILKYEDLTENSTGRKWKRFESEYGEEHKKNCRFKEPQKVDGTLREGTASYRPKKIASPKVQFKKFENSRFMLEFSGLVKIF